MDAIEMQFASARVTEMDFGAAKIDERPTEFLHSLRSADTYAWTVETMKAVKAASHSVPTTATVSAVTAPGHAGFWWFGKSGIVGPYVALLWRVQPDHLVTEKGLPIPTLWIDTFAWSTRAVPRVSGPTLIWPFDRSIDQAMDTSLQTADAFKVADRAIQRPNEWDGWNSEHETWLRIAARFFLAGCVWLQQRILVTSVGHIERHRRKQFAREHHISPPADVKVVELRRRESTPHEPSQSGAPVEWSCQWIVSGHWTHQAHGPKQGERRLQYILPYMKGPGDKPLKVPKQTVYLVNR